MTSEGLFLSGDGNMEDPTLVLRDEHGAINRPLDISGLRAVALSHDSRLLASRLPISGRESRRRTARQPAVDLSDPAMLAIIL